jgi:hypothetical protein
MTPYITRVTQLTVTPHDEPTYSDMATTLTIDSEGGGEFLVIVQPTRVGKGIAIDPSEWPRLRAAINRMIGECKDGL